MTRQVHTRAPAPAPEPCDVGIIAALPIEIAPFRAQLQDVRKHHVRNLRILEGRVGDKLVALVISGPGRRAARRATEQLVLGHRPRWIISTGFAGALAPEITRHQVVIPSRISDPEGQSYLLDAKIESDTILSRKHLYTADAIVRTAREKAALRETTHADLIDMESSAIAKVCSDWQIYMISIRVISDTAQDDLPSEVMTIMGATGSFRVGAVAGALWRRPSCIPELWELRSHAVEGARRLAKILPTIIRSLP